MSMVRDAVRGPGDRQVGKQRRCLPSGSLATKGRRRTVLYHRAKPRRISFLTSWGEAQCTGNTGMVGGGQPQRLVMEPHCELEGG